jgi:hypothetical protein
MAFRAAGATIVGSTTAGRRQQCVGDPLPGGQSSMISGLGVFYPDKRPTQRVGIVPTSKSGRRSKGSRLGRTKCSTRPCGSSW